MTATISYKDLKEKHSKEFNTFSKVNIFYAFSNEQFNEGMKKLNLLPDETDKIYSIGGGGFILKIKSEDLSALMKQQDRERAEAISNDKDGTGYIKEMFEYEMGNHEYGYTCDLDDTLDCLGLTAEEVMSNEALKNGLELAHKSYREWFNVHG